MSVIISPALRLRPRCANVANWYDGSMTSVQGLHLHFPLTVEVITQIVIVPAAIHVARNWGLQPLTGRSRDNLTNPVMNGANPYVPANMLAVGDLFDMFDFDHGRN